MTLIDRMARWIVQRAQPPSTTVSATHAAVGWVAPTGSTISGVRQQTIMAIAAVYRCRQLICGMLSMLPLVQEQVRWEDGREVRTRMQPRTSITRPDPFWPGSFHARFALLDSLLFRGNAFAWPTSIGDDGFPASWSVLSPDAVTRQMSDGQLFHRIFDQWVPYGVLLDLRSGPMAGSYDGVGVIEAAATLRTAVATQQRAEQAATTGDLPTAVIKIPVSLGNQVGDDGLTPHQRIQARWRTATAAREGAPIVIDNGADFEPLSLTPRDVQLIESQQWQASEIAGLFGVPPSWVSGHSGTTLDYKNVRDDVRLFMISTLNMWAEIVEQGLSAWLLPRGIEVRHDFDRLLEPDVVERMTQARDMSAARLWTVGEARDYVGIYTGPVEAQQEEDVTDA